MIVSCSRMYIIAVMYESWLETFTVTEPQLKMHHFYRKKNHKLSNVSKYMCPWQ